MVARKLPEHLKFPMGQGDLIPITWDTIEEVTDRLVEATNTLFEHEENVRKSKNEVIKPNEKSVNRECFRAFISVNIMMGYSFIDLSNYRPELGEDAGIYSLKTQDLRSPSSSVMSITLREANDFIINNL